MTKRWLTTGFLFVSVFVRPLPGGQGAAGPSVVKVIAGKGGYSLLVNGEPYHVRGGGGWEFLDQLRAAGGNSVRTWGAATDGEVLERAHRLGLTVMFGLWLGQVQHGFNYADPKAVQEQLEKMRALVRRYKDHPALLIWGVGNEIELGTTEGGSDPNIWKAVEEVTGMIKREDPNHPAMPVVAGLTEKKAAAIKKLCPSVDGLGINGYGGMARLPQMIKEFGWNKPYIVTEFGPPGPWGQAPRASWGAAIEKSSTAKAATYLAYYHNSISSEPGGCLGSYVYFWGVEPRFVTTHTWYETFLPGSNERLEAVDALTLAWTGKLPANRAPEILFWQSDAALIEVPPASRQGALVVARDDDGDRLRIRWEVRKEMSGSVGPAPTVVDECKFQVDATTESDQDMSKQVTASNVIVRTSFNAPKDGGSYRLFVYVYDGKGQAATANIPFYVRVSK